MSDFTPGPWQADFGTEGYFFITHSDGLEVPQTHANLAMLGAGPELFTALEDFDNWFCGFNPDDQASRMEGRKVVIRARAALAKARAS